MKLPTANQALEMDLEGTDIRSRWLEHALHGRDIDRLRDRLERELDQGAGATLLDIGRPHAGDTDGVVAANTRGPIAGGDGVLHHARVSDFALADAPDTTHWIEAGSVAIPARVRRTSSPVLIVTLHGVLRRDKYRLPRFEWMNSLRGLGHNVLSFGDATMDLHPGMEGGWWLGTASVDLVPQLALLVAETATTMGTEHLIIAGSSMGGFGALQLGAYFSEATVVAFNPQTDVRRYHARSVARTAMGTALGSDVEADVTRVDVLARYRATGTTPSRIRYVTNMGDNHHIQDHYEPFAEAISTNTHTTLARSWRDDGAGHVKKPPHAFVSTLEEEIRSLEPR